ASRSSEGSVNRPDFWTASFSRISSVTCRMSFMARGLHAARRALADPCSAFGRGTGAAACLRAARLRQAARRGVVAAVAGGEKARHATDGGDAHARETVDTAVGQATLETIDKRPEVCPRLQLGGRAQIAQERAALLRCAQGGERGAQVALGECFLARGDVVVGLHGMSV